MGAAVVLWSLVLTLASTERAPAPPPVLDAGVLHVDGDAHADEPPDACPGDGSTGSPFRSLACALSSGSLREGSTLRIHDAAPYEGASTAGLGVPAGITVEPEPGHAPILVGPLVLEDAAGWTVRGLVLDGSDGSAPSSEALVVSGASAGVRIEAVTVRSWPGRGIVVREADDAVVIGNRIEGARDVGIWVQDADGVRVEGNEIAGVECSASTFTLCDACGPDLCAPCGDCLGVQEPECTATSEHAYGGQAGIRVLGDASGAEVRGNHVHDFLDDACGAEGTRTAGIFITGEQARDGRIAENLVERIAPGNTDNGYGILLFQSASSWVIEHNVLASIGHCGLCEGDPLFYGGVGTQWRRNTVLDVEGSGIDVRWAAQAEVVGNLVADVRGGPVRVWPEGIEQPPAFTHNAYWGGQGDEVGRWGDERPRPLAEWQAACGCDDESVVGDPELLPPPLDPTPGPSSAAIDLGPPIEGSPTFGDAPDAGAVEVPRVLDATITDDEPSVVQVVLAGGPLVGAEGCVGITVEAAEAPRALVGCTAEAQTLRIQMVEPMEPELPVVLRYQGRHLVVPMGIGEQLGASLRAFSVTVLNGVREPDPGDPSGTGTSTGGTGYDEGYADDGGFEEGCSCRGGGGGPGGAVPWLLGPLLWRGGSRRAGARMRSRG